MFPTALVMALLVAAEKPKFTSPKSATPEYGHGLSKKQAGKGWISLFDRKTGFGWKDANVIGGRLSAGTTTAEFADCEVQADVATPGRITVAGRSFDVESGTFRQRVTGGGRGAIQLGKHVSVRQLIIRPLRLKSMFNGKDLSGWTILHHPRRPRVRKAKWSVVDGAIRALGGPGALELPRDFGNLVLQLDVRTRSKLVNAGVVFRCIRGDFMNGYEAQVFNAC